MKIDVTQIENYDTMSAEEKLSALEAFEFDAPEPKKSDSEVRLKNALDKASSDVASLKKQLKDKMGEAERMEAERAEREAEREALLKEYQRKEQVANHTANFLSVGFEKEIATKSAEALIDGDFDTVFANFKSCLENQEKALKAEAIKSVPKPVKGNANNLGTTTKEQFDKMGYSDRLRLFNENRELYDELNK